MEEMAVSKNFEGMVSKPFNFSNRMEEGEHCGDIDKLNRVYLVIYTLLYFHTGDTNVPFLDLDEDI